MLIVRWLRPLAWLSLVAIATHPGIEAAAPAQGPSDTQDETTVPPKANTPAPAQAKAKAKAKRRADPPGTYMGRRIAPVMSYLGADWLIRESRVAEEQPDRMLDALKLKPGDVVADVGAGVGYHSVKLAERVGPTGQVYATDVQPEMIRMLRDNLRRLGVTNVKPILCTQTQTGLPDGQIDLALMVDVYHECSDPEAVLSGLKRALKPGGRLVLVEFRGEDPEVPIKPEHKMTLRQVRRELEPQGFVFKESLEFLPWQHIIIFENPGEPQAPEGEPKPSGPDPCDV